MNFSSTAKLLAYSTATALCALSLAGPASAAVVDFEDVAVASGVNDVGGDRVSGGFTFDSSTDHTHLGNDVAAAAGNNGTTYLVVDDFQGAATMTMSLVGGGTFGLASLDIAEWGTVSGGDEATQIRITGNLFAGGSLSTTLTLDGVFDGVGGVADFETFAIGWSGLSSVVFDAVAGSGDRYYALDNISTEVSEAASLGLLGLGLIGLGFAARRRR